MCYYNNAKRNRQTCNNKRCKQTVDKGHVMCYTNNIRKRGIEVC